MNLLTLSTFIHIATAALLVGGVFFFRVILIKYASRTGGLSEELRATLTRRWLHVAFGFLLVLLLSGLYNLSQKMGGWSDADSSPSPHMLFGIKFLLFLAILVLTTVAAIAKTDAARARRPLLMTLNLILGLGVIFFSVWLGYSY